jgi:hypothetical protein
MKVKLGDFVYFFFGELFIESKKLDFIEFMGLVVYLKIKNCKIFYIKLRNQILINWIDRSFFLENPLIINCKILNKINLTYKCQYFSFFEKSFRFRNKKKKNIDL